MTDLSGAKMDLAQLRAKREELKNDSIPNSQQRNEFAQINAQIAEAMRSQKVETQPIGLTVSKDGEHIDGTDLHVADQAAISRMQAYTNKQTVINTFADIPISEATGKPMTEKEMKQYVENLKKERDKAKKEMEKAVALVSTEYYNNSSESIRIQLSTNAEETTNRYNELARSYELARINYDLMRGKGAANDIVKAAKQNTKDMTNVNNVVQAFPNDELRDVYLETHPGDKDKVVVLGEKEYNALLQLQAYGLKVLEQAKSSYGNSEISEDEYNRLVAFYSKYDAMVNNDGSINVAMAKDVIVDYTGSDHCLNISEKTALGKTIYTKDKYLAKMVKAIGFGVESGNSQRWKAAATAAVPAFLANLGTWLAFGKDYDSDLRPFTQYEGYTTSTATDRLSYTDANGNNVIEYLTQVVAQPQTSQQAAFAEASTKFPWLATLAAPVASGILAYFLCKPESENLFKGVTLGEIIENRNLENVAGDAGKAVVNKILDMSITGDKTYDDRIKVAVLQQCIGQQDVAVNLRELLGAYDALIQVKEKIEQLPVEPEQTPTPSVTPTPPTQTPTPGGDVTPTTPTPTPGTEPCTQEVEETDGFNVTHVSGMYPYGIAERLGIPKKYQREFVEMYCKDNAMDRTGKKYRKNPFIRNVYQFSDGTKYEINKTQEEVQELLNKKWNSGRNSGASPTSEGRNPKITTRTVPCDQ